LREGSCLLPYFPQSSYILSASSICFTHIFVLLSSYSYNFCMLLKVLSCMRDAESTSSSSFTLWLHVLSFFSTAHPSHKSAASKRSGTSTGAGAGQESDGPLTVKGRLRVAEHADINLKNRQRAGNPQLLRLLLQRAAEQSWRLYISW
jgi:hypothetical protein